MPVNMGSYTFAAVLVAAGLWCIGNANAQWGGSNSPFGNEGANPVPGGSSPFGGGGPATGGPGSFSQGTGDRSSRHQTPSGETLLDQFDPFPKDRTGEGDEYQSKWVPTGRPGFEVPPNIKKIQEQNAARSNSKGPKEQARTQERDGYAHGKGETEEDEFEDVDEPIPKEAPGRKGQGRSMDKCLRQVAHFCSLRVMQENFAAFNDCIYEMRYRLRADCQPWAEGHGFCVRDMVAHCPRLSPQDTTECLHKKKLSLTKTCVDSAFYASMEEGFRDFREGMKEGMKGKPQGPGRYSGPQTTEEEDGEAMPTPRGAKKRDVPLADEDDVVILTGAGKTSGRARTSDKHEEL
jgi:hypothetical protein